MTYTLPITIGVVPKNKTEQVNITLQEFKGAKLCDIRVFGTFRKADELSATPKGISINISKLRSLIEVLIEAENKAHELGLIGASKD